MVTRYLKARVPLINVAQQWVLWPSSNLARFTIPDTVQTHSCVDIGLLCRGLDSNRAAAAPHLLSLPPPPATLPALPLFSPFPPHTCPVPPLPSPPHLHPVCLQVLPGPLGGEASATDFCHPWAHELTVRQPPSESPPSLFTHTSEEGAAATRHDTAAGEGSA